MKKLFSFAGLFLLAVSVFAGPLIDAAKKQDFKTFEVLINDGAPLEEIDESGLNLQLSLAYFNDKDFTKACKLLNKKGFDFDVPVENNISLVYILAYSCSYNKLSELLKYNVDVNRKNSLVELKPIDATQFSTFKFYSEQKINSDAYEKAEKTRKLLIKSGSENFTYSPLTMKRFGNFFYCIFNIVYSFYPFVTPDMINASDLFDFSEINGQENATILKNKMIELFDSINIKADVSNYYDKKSILEKLIEIEQSEDYYMLIGSTGYNSLAPYQWINVNGVNFSSNKSSDAELTVSNPDGSYQFINFQVKDLSQLIVIKIAK